MNRLSDTDVLDSEVSNTIDAQAASWFARNHSDTARADRKAFAEWHAVPAHARAYAMAKQVNWPQGFYRRDIGHRAL